MTLHIPVRMSFLQKSYFPRLPRRCTPRNDSKDAICHCESTTRRAKRPPQRIRRGGRQSRFFKTFARASGLADFKYAIIEEEDKETTSRQEPLTQEVYENHPLHPKTSERT
jgi:hypothetical protein